MHTHIHTVYIQSCILQGHLHTTRCCSGCMPAYSVWVRILLCFGDVLFAGLISLVKKVMHMNLRNNKEIIFAVLATQNHFIFMFSLWNFSRNLTSHKSRAWIFVGSRRNQRNTERDLSLCYYFIFLVSKRSLFLLWSLRNCSFIRSHFSCQMGTVIHKLQIYLGFYERRIKTHNLTLEERVEFGLATAWVTNCWVSFLRACHPARSPYDPLPPTNSSLDQEAQPSGLCSLLYLSLSSLYFPFSVCLFWKLRT